MNTVARESQHLRGIAVIRLLLRDHHLPLLLHLPPQRLLLVLRVGRNNDAQGVVV
jgi:hypothetical protein